MVADRLPGFFIHSLPALRLGAAGRRLTGSVSLLRQCCGYAVAITITALVVFHASILYNHLLDGRLADPGVAFRWVIGGLLAGSLVAFRRMGISLVRGRRALVIWVLVALLHVSTARTVSAPLFDLTPEDAAIMLVVLPAAAPVLLGAVLLLVTTLRSVAQSAPDLRLAWLARDAGARLRVNPLVPLLASRAPPRCHI
jgi:hypothetical protein